MIRSLWEQFNFMQDFKSLMIWQKAMKVCEDTFALTTNINGLEFTSLVQQANRSGVSVPSNIAEGAGRKSQKEFARFLNIAFASSCELVTQILLIQRMIPEHDENCQCLLEELDPLQRMMNTFLAKVDQTIIE